MKSINMESIKKNWIYIAAGIVLFYFVTSGNGNYMQQLSSTASNGGNSAAGGYTQVQSQGFQEPQVSSEYVVAPASIPTAISVTGHCEMVGNVCNFVRD